MQEGDKEVPALFEEADGLWISIQGKDRQKMIECREKRAKKARKEFKIPKKVKSELKLHVMYEGWEKDNRHRLVEKEFIAGFMSFKELNRIRTAKIYEKYKLSPKILRVLNGDGATWIRKLKVKGQFYEKDSFHIGQEIVRTIKNKEQQEELKKS